jgi:hypothetical protein
MLDTTLPEGCTVSPTGDPDHPFSADYHGQKIATETEKQAVAWLWRCAAEDLARGKKPAPHPAPVGLVRELCELVGGQRAAWRLLKIKSERTVRGWCMGETTASHAAVEILRLAAGNRYP